MTAKVETESMNVSNSSSWGDMLRTIDHDRKNLSWDPNQTQRVQRIGHYDVKRKETEYDIIAIKYRSPEKESMVTTKREEFLRTKLKTAEDIKRNQYNIISHSGPPRKYDEMIHNREKINPPRKYNFFSNMNHDDHDHAPTIYDEEYAEPRAGRPKVVRPAVNKGEYNIVSNYFFEGHDERIAKEYENFKNHTLEKYWQTHDYDPIRGKYYDADKELRYKEQRELITQVHGSSKIAKIPPSILYSDGSAYDIVNHTVSDEQRLELSRTVANRSLNRMRRNKVEKKFKEDGQIAYDEAEKARLARVKYNRWEQEMDRSYDLVKNTVINLDQRPQPLPTRVLPLWGKLQSTNHTMQSSSSTNQLIMPSPSLQEQHNRHNYSNNNETSLGNIANTVRTRNLSGAGPAYLNTNTVSPSVSIVNTSMHSSGSAALYVPPQTAPSNHLPYYYNQSTSSSNQGTIEPNRLPATIALPSSQQTSARAKTAVPVTIMAGGGGVSRPTATTAAMMKVKPSSLSSVPSLDLSKAEQAPMVSYIEPTQGPASMPIAMVRTGGLSSYRQ